MEEIKFTREALINSNKIKSFGLNRYILSAILTKDEYTLEDAIKAIQDFKNNFNKG